MKERGLPFMAPMVNATLDDRKTQTRRPVKGTALDWLDNEGFTPEFVASPENHLCPYGVPGDRLWVREHYRVSNKHDGIPPREIPKRRCTVFFDAGGSIANQFSGQWEQDRNYSAKDAGEWVGKFRPGMFMCRWMSRILLEVVSVRVERLQDISEADAIAEGVMTLGDEWQRSAFPNYYADFDASVAARTKPPLGPSPKQRYAALWDQINGAGSWDLNPWVWVVVFKRINP